MQGRYRRILAILLTCVMLLSLMPAASAASGSGTMRFFNPMIHIRNTISDEDDFDLDDFDDLDLDELFGEDDAVSILEDVYVKFMPPASVTLNEKDSVSVSPVVTGDDGTITYSWSVDDSSVASVSGRGGSATIQGRKAGITTVKMTAKRASDGDSSSDTLTVKVEAPSTPLTVSANGSTRLTMNDGETQNISASVSGGSGSYIYDWSVSDNCVYVVDNGNTSSSATIRGLCGGTDQVTLTVVDKQDESKYATVTWTVTVNQANKPLTAKLDKTSLTLQTGGSATLSISASGGSGNSANYEYYWVSEDPSVASVSGSGSTVTILAGNNTLAGATSTVIEAAVVDTSSNSVSEPVSCVVSIQNNKAAYDASGSARAGESMALNPIANSIAGAYSSQFGTALNLSASVRLSTPSNASGTICLQDGTHVQANASYSYAGLQDMIFQAKANGSLSTGYTITDGGNTITGTITISVVGGIPVTSATMSPSSITLSPYSSQFLNLTVSPANASYNVTWTTSDPRLIAITGGGGSVTVISQGGTGSATVTATITDSTGGVITRSVPVVVASNDDRDRSSNNRSYDPSLTVTIGSDYYGSSISDSIAKQWRHYFGSNLENNATVRFTNVGTTRYGKLHLNGGIEIRANTDYSFLDLINMYFEPYATGTFSIPYSISYRGYRLGGTISFYVRSTSLSVDINPGNVTMSTYSSQYVRLNINPSNVYYRVEWSSSNPSIATVNGNGANATINSTGRSGTATITATVIDGNSNRVYRSCGVQVNNTTASSNYDPTVYTTLGVNYTGTGTSDAMASQFRNVYNTNLDVNNATIRLDSTGDNNVGVLRLSNGNAAKANTTYSFSQYKSMYLVPVSAGTFRVPYTLTYNGKTLYGTSSFVISSGSVNCTMTLLDSQPYLFSNGINGGSGGALLSNAISNAVGSSWSYVRFNSTSDNVGTLYQNNGRAVLNSGTNISAVDMSKLYFVPTRPGTFTATYTVYNNNGKMADGALNIIVPGNATTSFTDVPSGAYYADAVSWAVQKEVTTGTSNTTFSPGNSVTRAQAVTFLWRTMGRPAAGGVNPFKDVAADEYYTQAVLWAVQQGITAGTSDTTFSPNATLAQDQMLTFLCRASGGSAGGDNWSDLAINWASGRGLFNGLPNQVSAKANCPRSDVVYYLWKNFG